MSPSTLQPSKSQTIQTLRRVMVGRIRIVFCLVALGALAALAVPVGASARQHHSQDFKSASKQCKALRAEMGNKAFKKAFGAGKHKRRALRRCIARGGVLPVSEQSVTPPPQCPPGTAPEQPQPVHAFAVPASPTVCVPTPPAATPSAPAATDEDADDGENEAGDRDDDADDRDEGHDGDEGHDEHESDRGKHDSDDD
jgi:hypothetical protein